MKNFYVDKLREGMRVEDVFLVGGKSVGRTQDGKLFVRLKLSDRAGAIDGIKWDATEALCSSLAVDDYVSVRGIVNKYKDKLQVLIDGVRKHTEDIDPADFIPATSKDISKMLADLRTIIDTVQQPQLRGLLGYFFENAEFVAKFSTAPAAKAVHHAYIGGLLEHSLSVTQLCDLVAGHYPELDRDLLITTAALHDIGKIEEFSWTKTIQYTDAGHLVGHLVGGAMMVDAAAEELGDFHPFMRLLLKHMILSHHGEYEFGSPKRPKTMEALVLHHVEDMDAKVEMFAEAVGAPGENADGEMWTERHWLLNRPLLKGLPKNMLRPRGEDEAEPKSGLNEESDPFAE